MYLDILGLTYSEFDNFVGPQLRYAYPVNCLSGEEFERLSDYVIVDKHLTNKMIVVQTENFQFANYSLIINNSKYDRNALLFAFGVLTKASALTRHSSKLPSPAPSPHEAALTFRAMACV